MGRVEPPSSCEQSGKFGMRFRKEKSICVAWELRSRELEGGRVPPAPHHHWQHMWLGTGLEVLNGLQEDVCVVKGRTWLTMNSEKQEGGLGSWFYKKPVSRSDFNVVTKALDKSTRMFCWVWNLPMSSYLQKKKRERERIHFQQKHCTRENHW